MNIDSEMAILMDKTFIDRSRPIRNGIVISKEKLMELKGKSRLIVNGIINVNLQGGRQGNISYSDLTICYILKGDILYHGLFCLSDNKIVNQFPMMGIFPERLFPHAL